MFTAKMSVTFAVGQAFPHLFGNTARYFVSMAHIGKADEDVGKEFFAKANEKVESLFAACETILSESPNVTIMNTPYPTAVDFLWFWTLAMQVRMGRDLDKQPSLKRWYVKIMEVPSIDAVWPKHWDREKKTGKNEGTFTTKSGEVKTFVAPAGNFASAIQNWNG